MNKDEIKKYLPHREPMLLIDEANLSEDGVYAVSKYYVTGDEWFLKGHYPNNPVVPGVILCEIMAQTCGILLGDKILGMTPYYTGIKEARFKKKVLPKNTIETTATVTKTKANFFFTQCTVRVNGEVCAQGNLSFALIEGRH